MQIYDNSDRAKNKDLSIEEVQSLQGSQRALMKDPDKVAHLLERTIFTLRNHEKKVGDLHASMEKIQRESPKSKHPMDVAIEALRDLSPEQREQIMGYHLAEKVAQAEKAAVDAERAQSGARNESNRLKFSISKIASDASTPSAVRTKLEEVLTSKGPVTVPTADLPPEKPFNGLNIPSEFLPPTR